MARLSIRLPDAIVASLRRELDSERAFRGRRYSLNDLCISKLAVSRHAERQQSDDTLTPVLRQVSHMPPPVPRIEPTIWPPAAAPQPERLTKPTDEDQHAEEPMDEQISRLEDEGGPDGNVGN